MAVFNCSTDNFNSTLCKLEYSAEGGIRIMKLVIVIIYGSLSIGILFNVTVASMIIRIFRSLKDRFADKHTFLYVLALSLVDTLVLANLPLIIMDIVMNQWIAGSLLCKMFWINDSINKTMSTFVLTLLSCDRYLAVCHPMRFMPFRNNTGAIKALALCCFSTVVLLSPCYLHTEVKTFRLHSINMTITKCLYIWSETSEQAYIYTLFAMGYCTPLVMMTFFHLNILKTLRRNDTRLLRVSIRRKNLTADLSRRMFFVTVFYFVCWSPYWMKVFAIQYGGSSYEYEDVGSWKPTLFLATHILVYVNSAVNPLIYGVCNFEIRRQRKEAVNKRTADVLITQPLVSMRLAKIPKDML